jgi:hypothetical protein
LISFTRIFSSSLWAVIILQSIFTSYLLWVLLKKEVTGNSLNTASKIAIVLVLNFASSMPWFASQLMPDIFTGLMGISLFLILFHWDKLGLKHKIAIGSIFIISMLVHSSHWAIGLSMVILWAFLLFRHKRFRTNLIAGASLLSLCFLIIPLTNLYYSGKFFYSQSTHVFILSRLIEDGLAQKLLTEHCRDYPYSLCPYSRDLQRKTEDYYLWDEKSPLQKTGWVESSQDSWKMIKDSLFYYPYAHLKALASDTIRQFVTFDTGDNLNFLKEDKTASLAVNLAIERLPLEQFAQYTNSQQLKGRLIKFLNKIRPIHMLIGMLFLILAVLSAVWLIFTKRIDNLWGRPDLSFLIFSLSFFMINGFICTVFTEVLNRYESRVIWLVILAVMVFLLNEWGLRTKKAYDT